MKSQVKNLPRGQAEITIEILPEEYVPFLKKAALRISENIKISGFRQGKTPYDIIKQRVGEGKIWEEALEDAVKKTLFNALKEKLLDTVGSPKIEAIKLAPNNPVQYKAVINLLPKINNFSLEGISIHTKKISIDNARVEKQLCELQKMRGKEILARRSAKAGDKAEVDFSLSMEKVPLEGGDVKKFPIYLGEKKFIPGFEENIIGLKEGDTKEFPLTFPKNYHQKNLAGKITECRVKILAVYEIQLPGLDDTFAKELRFKDFNDLKSNIENNLMAEMQNAEEKRIEDEIIDTLIEKNKFSAIPDILIDSEVKTMLSEIEQSVANQGVSFDEYLLHMEKTKDQMLIELAPSAAKRIKGAILFREVAKNNSISVSEDEITKSLESLKTQYANDEHAKKTLNSPEYPNYLAHTLTSQKVMRFLKEKIVK